MDPNATLRVIMDLRARLIHEIDNPDEDSLGDRLEEASHDISELCDLIGAIDTWISKGGFLPEKWDVKRADPVACKLCVGKGVLADGMCFTCRGSGDESKPNVHDPRTGCWVPVL